MLRACWPLSARWPTRAGLALLLGAVVQFSALVSGSAPALAGDSGTSEVPVDGAGASGAGGSGAADAATEAENFDKELLTTEQQVDALKERVFRAKATLQLLKEIVIEGSSSGARATIWHVNRLSSGFHLESVQYLLDGQSKFSKADPAGSLDESREFKIHDGAVPPGNHNLSVDLKIRPASMGVFTYARNYEINVRSNYAFNAELGKTCTVRAVITDRGGVVNSFEERAKVDFELKCERITDGK